nr:uncharacterized protein ZK1073.1-like [Penaeus vannamei]
MKETKDRSIFIHVDIPGQEDNAPDLPNDYQFPTMQSIAEDLVAILDQLKVKLVIGLGEGAGANILARFGMAQPERCMGLILIHCTSTTAGVMEHFKDKIISWKAEQTWACIPPADSTHSSTSLATHALSGSCMHDSQLTIQCVLAKI